MKEILETLKAKIENGAKYNGTVYGKFNGKNWVTFSIYLDGQYTKVCEVSKSVIDETKREIENALKVSPKVNNNLGYGEAYLNGGLDFASGEGE